MLVAGLGGSDPARRGVRRRCCSKCVGTYGTAPGGLITSTHIAAMTLEAARCCRSADGCRGGSDGVPERLLPPPPGAAPVAVAAVLAMPPPAADDKFAFKLPLSAPLPGLPPSSRVEEAMDEVRCRGGESTSLVALTAPAYGCGSLA